MALKPEAKEMLEEQLAKDRSEEEKAQLLKNMDTRAERVPFLRHCFRQQTELDTVSQNRAKHANAALKVAQMQRTENLAYEMRHLNDEEFCDLKRRQQLRENCPELRDLEKKLNAAYMNKILQEQIREKDAKRLLEEMTQRNDGEKILAAHISEKEHFKHEREIRVLKQQEYKRELQDQMIFQENARRSKYEEFLKEKKKIDELVLRIQEEEEREMQLKYCAMLQTQEDIRRFKENQEQWRQKARERVEKEDYAIQQFIHDKMAQTKKLGEEKAAKELAKSQLADAMAKKMYVEKRKQMERDEILSELLEAEERESHERKHREKVEKDLRTRLEIHRQLNTQMQERLEHMRQEAERDARYKQELMAQQAEFERLEQLSDKKRRLRIMQLRRDVAETIKNSRLQKALDMQLKIKEQEMAQEEAEKRRLWIENERVRMIKEHAENLIGFLPVGIMSESELDKLGDDLKMKLTCNNMLHGNN